MPLSQTLEILHSMAERGHIDADLHTADLEALSAPWR
jgi:hypothetical protein